jgi:hypothetical protein
MTGHLIVAEPQARAYLEAVAAGLAGPWRRRRRILAELGDGLDRAAAVHAAAGLRRHEAMRVAIDGFGTPAAVAGAFAGELATATARRMLGWFVVTGPLVGVWWLLLLYPYPWRAGVVALVAAIPVVPLVAVALATAAGTFATTGRLIRWLPETGPRDALAAATAVGVLVVGADVTLIALYLGSGPTVRPLAVVAVTAGLTRIGCGLAAVRHATARRHRLADRTGRDVGR